MKYCFTTIVEPKLKRYTDVTQQTNVAVDMGSIALFCRGSALCGCDDHLTHHVQTSRLVKCRYHTLHFMALSAMGHQTALEPVRGYTPIQTLVDSGDATAHRGSLGWCGVYHTRSMVVARVAMFLLVDGVR